MFKSAKQLADNSESFMHHQCIIVLEVHYWKHILQFVYNVKLFWTRNISLMLTQFPPKHWTEQLYSTSSSPVDAKPKKGVRRRKTSGLNTVLWRQMLDGY